MNTTAHDNPFASHLVESLSYRSKGFDFNGAVDRLSRMNWRGAILGRHGTGKTTLLLQLHEYLKRHRSLTSRTVRFWFIPREQAAKADQWSSYLETCRPDEIVLVDGVERMSWLVRRQLLGHLPVHVGANNFRWLPRSVVVTAHRRIGLPVWHRTKSSMDLMQELLLELHPRVSKDILQRATTLFRQSKGDVREVFWRLYDSA